MAAPEPARSRRILLVTNIDRGEANVFLAVAHALARAEPPVQLHFASFTGLEASVASVWESARRAAPQAIPIVFHEIRGLPMAEGLRQYFSRKQVPVKENQLPASFMAAPGLSNTTRAIRDAVPIFVPYSGPQLLEVFSSIVEIIKGVAADLVVVDSLMTAALTACYHLGVKFACLSPNAIKEFAAPQSAMGSWPLEISRVSEAFSGGEGHHLPTDKSVADTHGSLFSGFQYPVPWYLTPLNAYYVLYTAKAFWSDGHKHKVQQYLASHAGATLRTPVDLLRNRPPGLKVLVSTLPELDFPVVVPPHVSPCGPILRVAPSVSETDPGLERWLARGPTVYVNLGSICRLTEDQALELALALKTVLQTYRRQSVAPRLQVLWKLKKGGEYEVLDSGCRIHGALGNEINADEVRIVDWLDAEPIAVLQTGHVACSIHHGGANSFNEAVW